MDTQHITTPTDTSNQPHYRFRSLCKSATCCLHHLDNTTTIGGQELRPAQPITYTNDSACTTRTERTAIWGSTFKAN